MADIAAQADAVGSLIRELRHARGLTLKELAALADLSHPFLSQVERGRARPSFASLDAIARALGTTQFDLFAQVSRRERGDDAAGPAGAAFSDGSVRVFDGEFRSLAPVEVVATDLEFGEYFTHPEEEFVYVLEGAMLADLDGTVSALVVGDGLHIPGGTPHRWRSADGRPFRKLHVKPLEAPAPHAPPRTARGGRMTVPPPEIDVTVRRRFTTAADVDVFELVAVDGRDLPAWRPGAHIDVLTDIGVERQYSLCGSPEERGVWRIGVLREDAGRGGSAWIHGALAPGARVRVRGPWNHFTLYPARAYRFVAGGIGITPLLPMIAAAQAAGADWTLDYSGRSRATMGFLEELAAHGERVRIHAGDQGARLDIPGIVPGEGELVYACGPARMLEALGAAADAWAPDTLHLERFEAREVGAPVRSEAFDVELAISGTTVTVTPEQSVLDAVEEAGVFVLSSCREGTCGTCETVVIEGEVDHRDSILSDHEREHGDRMMVCVSRAACPRLVLEL